MLLRQKLFLVFRLSTLIRDKLLVSGLNSTNQEPLNYYPNGSFVISWEKNSLWQLQFTAIEDGSLAYRMLEPEALITWKGQQFVVKQCVSDYQEGISTKQVVATHVYSEIQRIRQEKVRSGTLTYSVEDVLEFGLNNNELGFTWRVIGEFPKHQITDLGNCSGKDILAKITDVWSDAVIFPDNKLIKIYQQEKFITNDSRRIDYLNNASEVKLSFDSTGIVNKVWAIGKQKEGTDNAEYYFQPFIVEDKDSINRYGVYWGEDISDERFTDSDNMRNYAFSQLTPDPTLTVEVSLMTNEEPIPGDVRRLEVREDGYVTEVEVVAYQYYPLDLDQMTQITLNNRAKTILNYRDNIQTNILKVIRSQRNTIGALQENIGNLEAQHKQEVDSLQSFKNQYEKTIAELRDQLSKLNGNSSTQHIGKIIDVSEWQGVIDWPQVIADDVSLSIIRVQDGSTHQDLKYMENIQKCISAGGKYAVYAYFRGASTADAQQEARDFYNRTQRVVAGKQQPVFYALDIESVEMGGAASQMRAGVEAYMNQLNTLGIPDNKIVLYIANHLYASFNLNVARAGAIWIPSYGRNDGTVANSLRPTHPYDLWQYSSKGSINGITGNVDLNTEPSDRFKKFLL
ncbi:phage tail protein [Ligilactobacillus agilis]|uniref:phage tail protein n=1 Tax=Ligilactobacillus agilis TaxID=1601 RepID=UPI001CDC1C10|nr:phage tail protein [Ligilactobacillus agilis]